MNAANALGALESASLKQVEGAPIYEACQWAIAQITGGEQPVSSPRRIAPRDPFLRSISR